MTIHASASQLLSAGLSDLRVTMTDHDAKEVMTRTPNVSMTVGGRTYLVYEVNPTVITDVYAVRLYSPLKNSVAADTPLTFEV